MTGSDAYLHVLLVFMYASSDRVEGALLDPGGTCIPCLPQLLENLPTPARDCSVQQTGHRVMYAGGFGVMCSEYYSYIIGLEMVTELIRHFLR